MDSDKLFSYANAFTTDECLAKLIQTVNQNEIDGIKFPKFPDSALQSNFVRSSGENALREAGVFYKVIENFTKKANVRIPEDFMFPTSACFGQTLICSKHWSKL